MSSTDLIGRKEYEHRQRQQTDQMAALGRSVVELRGMIAETRAFIDHLSKLTDQRFAAATEALRLALTNMDKRLDQMNEFRSQLKDQAATFVTRELLDQMVAGIETDISNVRTLVSAIQQIQASTGGQQAGSKSTNTAWVAAVISIASTIAGIIVVVVVH